VPPVTSALVDPDLWDNIISAMRENRLITFEYDGIWDDHPHTRLVRPYQMLFDTGVWFLYGYAEERSAIRIFTLSRIKHISLANERFNLTRSLLRFAPKISKAPCAQCHLGTFLPCKLH
jgi:predicted DNA-binding transcriptional regulator YafY